MIQSLHNKAPDREHEAREWFVRLLDADVSHEDLVAWSQWLEADPGNREAYEGLAGAWSLAGESRPIRPAAAELAQDRYDPALPVAQWRRRQKGRFRLAAAGAAGLVLAACIAGFALTRDAAQPTQQLATSRGQHLDAQLTDGSAVSLGAATSVQVRFQAGRRNIGLPRGEAQFKVAHDKSRPFIVRTPLAAVTAVGTAFNLDVQADRVVLYVNEGIVDVDLGPAASDPGHKRTVPPLRIAAGDRLTMDMKAGRLVAVQEPMAPPPTWQSGRLEYRDQSLATILEDVNRYAPRPIILADPGIGDLKFTGTVRLDATEAWAFGLPAAFPLTVNPRPDGLLLRKKRTSPPPGAPRIS